MAFPRRAERGAGHGGSPATMPLLYAIAGTLGGAVSYPFKALFSGHPGVYAIQTEQRGTSTPTLPVPVEAPEEAPEPKREPAPKKTEPRPWYKKPFAWAGAGLGILAAGTGAAAADALNVTPWDYLNRQETAFVKKVEGMPSLMAQIQPAAKDPDAKAMIGELYQLSPNARASLRDSGLLVIYAQDGDITDDELARVENWKIATEGFDDKNHRLAATFVGDNPESIEFPAYLNTQVIPQIRANVADWMGIWYPDNTRARTAINQQWDNMYGIHQKGEIIRRLDSNAPPFFLPRAMLTADMQERTCVEYLDPNGYMNPVKYNPNRGDLRPNLIDFLERNASYFPVRHGEIWVMVTDLDGKIKSGPVYYTPEHLLSTRINGFAQLPEDWPKHADLSKSDLSTILKDGSTATKRWVKVYAGARTLGRGQDECAVETGISDLLTIGERGYRLNVKYPTIDAWHGELAGELVPEDESLLKAQDSSPLFVAENKGSRIWTPLWSRTKRVEDNGSKKAVLILPTGEEVPIYSKE